MEIKQWHEINCFTNFPSHVQMAWETTHMISRKKILLNFSASCLDDLSAIETFIFSFSCEENFPKIGRTGNKSNILFFFNFNFGSPKHTFTMSQ